MTVCASAMKRALSASSPGLLQHFEEFGPWDGLAGEVAVRFDALGLAGGFGGEMACDGADADAPEVEAVGVLA